MIDSEGGGLHPAEARLLPRQDHDPKVDAEGLHGPLGQDPLRHCPQRHCRCG